MGKLHSRDRLIVLKINFVLLIETIKRKFFFDSKGIDSQIFDAGKENVIAP